EWAERWERGSYGEPVVSLGAELVDEEGNALARLPWGARVLRFGSTYELPDGRRGTVGSGEVVGVDRLADRFPARGESIARAPPRHALPLGRSREARCRLLRARPGGYVDAR